MRWVGHLRDYGFEVTTYEVDDIAALQEEHGVPAEFRSCHSALVDGHMVEGHVPADLLESFIEEDAEFTGITVPGMPVGPPGMEGDEPMPYDVLVFDKDGNSTIYESR